MRGETFKLQFPSLQNVVKYPDKGDWKKTCKMPSVLESYITHETYSGVTAWLCILNWFIDSAHQVHGDCKGHTGGALTLGKGTVISKLAGQKINTKGSLGSELVLGVDDYFIEAQGNNIEHNIIHQDNDSTLRMLINGKKSRTPCSKHSKATFLAKDYHDNKEIEFAKCHTEKGGLTC